MELSEAILNRKSTRIFEDKKIPQRLIKKIIDLGYKIPSAGDLRPIKIYAPCFDEFPQFLIICADFKRTIAKYGERGHDYILMEAGHTAQNICLVCEEAGLGSCCIGAFNNSKIMKKYNLPHYPVYMVVIGYERK